MKSLFGDISNIISLAITPAFLILGVLLQLRVLNNRLERIVSRQEALEQRLSGGAGTREVLRHELGVLYRRADVIHRAVGFSSLSMVTVCAVVITLFADDAFGLQLASLVAFLFVAAMALLICSFSLFLHEIFIASHTMPSTALLTTRRQEPHR
jgi:hypothetical protein